MYIDYEKAWKKAQILVNDFVASLPNLLLAILVFALFLVIGRYAAQFTRTLSTKARRSPTVGILLGRMAQYLAVILGTLIALSVIFPSFKAADLIQVLGIGGIAIGFAFKDIFQNFLAGIMILIARPFRIGDHVLVKGYEGVVEDIQTRATMLRTHDNRLVVVPNMTMYSLEVTVLTAYSKRRLEQDIKVANDQDLDRVKELAIQVLHGIDSIDKQPEPDIIVLEFDKDETVLRLRWWAVSTQPNLLGLKDTVLTDLRRALLKENIGLSTSSEAEPEHDDEVTTGPETDRESA